MVVYPHDHQAGLGAVVLPCPERTIPHIAWLGKDQNSKCKAQFLLNAHHFHTIVKSKYCTWNHPKSGTICSNLWSQDSICYIDNLKQKETLKSEK